MHNTLRMKFSYRGTYENTIGHLVFQKSIFKQKNTAYCQDGRKKVSFGVHASTIKTVKLSLRIGNL